MILERFLLFFLLLNLVTGLGVVASPLGADVSPRDWKSLLRDMLWFLLGALWIWVVDFLLCRMAGLSFLRVLIVFLNLALLNGLEPLLVRGRTESFGDRPDRYVPLAAFLMLALPGGGDPLSFAGALLGALCGGGVALAVHDAVMARLELEWVPPGVRGQPLAFFVMGFVSLVFLLTGQILRSALAFS